MDQNRAVLPTEPSAIQRWEASEDNILRSRLVVANLACFRDEMTAHGHPRTKPVAVQMIGALDEGVAPEQVNTLNTLVASESEIYATARAAIYKRYQETYPIYRPCFSRLEENLIEKILPRIVTGSEIDGLIVFKRFYVNRPVNGRCQIGFSLSCPWDVEHGMGLILSEGKAVYVGVAGVVAHLETTSR